VIQTVVETSPPKWHLAHVSWFFETFLLQPYLSDYQPFHPRFDYLFNSYYEQLDSGYRPRPERGLLSRPTVAEIYDYRRHVDAAMERLIGECSTSDWPTVRERLYKWPTVRERLYKYSVDGFHALAGEAGYETERVWTDADGLSSAFTA